jgi:hypothetical protein
MASAESVGIGTPQQCHAREAKTPERRGERRAGRRGEGRRGRAKARRGEGRQARPGEGQARRGQARRGEARPGEGQANGGQARARPNEKARRGAMPGGLGESGRTSRQMISAETSITRTAPYLMAHASRSSLSGSSSRIQQHRQPEHGGQGPEHGGQPFYASHDNATMVELMATRCLL